MQNTDLQTKISSTPFEVNIGKAISDGFNLFGKRPGLFIGAFVLFMLITFGIAMIPFASFLGSLVVQPVMLVGFFILADKVNYNEDVQIGDLFNGFKQYTGNIILANLFIGLIAMIPFVIFIALMFGILGTSFITAANAPEEFAQALMGGSGLLLGLAFLFLFIVIFYISVSYQYGSMFVYFRGLPAWEALESSRKLVSRRFFSFFGLLFVLGLINIAGMIPLGLGLLVTAPVSYIAMYLVFDSVIGSREVIDEDDQIMEHLISEQ